MTARLQAAKFMMAALLTLSALPVFASGDSLAAAPDKAAPTFTLAAPKGAWKVIAYGDMRFTDPSNTKVTNPVARRALVNKIAEEKPDALLLSGDVPYDGSNAADYVVFRDETAPWRAAGLHVYPAMGNHELHGGDSLTNWWNAFPELKGRRWYSVKFADAYFLTVDSNLDLTPGSEQAAWITHQLAGLPKSTRYVFVSLHHPPVADGVALNPSHNVRPNEDALAKQLEEAAKHISARIIVVAGHIHAYQRFERNGVVYLVSGGGGAAQHLIARTPNDLYQDNVFPNFHYIRFESEKGSLKATMYRLDAQGSFVVGDSFLVPAGPAKK
jgi:hypothetical protein